MTATSGPERPIRLDPDELATLEEQRDFLLRSLEDLEREYEAGDLTDEDHRTLRDGDGDGAHRVFARTGHERLGAEHRSRAGGPLEGVPVFAQLFTLDVEHGQRATEPARHPPGGVSKQGH